MEQCQICGREFVSSGGSAVCADCRPTQPAPGKSESPGPAQYIRRFPATTGLIAINVAVFLAMVIGHVSATTPTVLQLIHWGADSGQHVLVGNQWWRIVTSAFVHIGAAHLLMNMWALWVLGTLGEAILGSYLFCGVYLVCAIAGSLASLYWNPFAVGAGASGAIMGILGAEVSVLKFARLPLPREVLRSTIRSLVQGAVLTLVIGVLPRIDNASHVGGLICGLFIGLLMSLTRRAGVGVQRPLRQICLIAPFALMVPLAFAVQRHGEPWVHYEKAVDDLDSSRYADAEREARLALRHLSNRKEVLAVLSTALYYQGNDAEATRYLKQMMSGDPHNEFAVNTLATIELKENDAIGARDLLMKSLPLQPRNAYGQVTLGRALQALNQDDQAIAHYRAALQITPDLYDAQMALASLYEKHDHPRDAILLYQKAAQHNPKDLGPLHGLARSYLAAGMRPEADQVILEIRQKEAISDKQ